MADAVFWLIVLAVLATLWGELFSGVLQLVGSFFHALLSREVLIILAVIFLFVL